MFDINTGTMTGKIHKLWDAKETKNGTATRGAVLEVESFNGFKARFDVSSFGDTAGVLGSFSEGDRVVIQYELQQNSWKKDDEWHNKIVLNVRSIHALAQAAIVGSVDSSASYDNDDDMPF